MDALVSLNVEAPALPAGLPSIIEQAKAIVINSPALAQVASTTLTQIKAMIKQVEGTFLEPGRAIDTAKRTLLDAKAKHLQPLLEVEALLKGGLVDWKAKQEAERAEAQRQAFLAAEKARQEAARAAEQERQAAIHAAEAVREEEAQALAEVGKVDEAQAVAAVPIVVAPVAPLPMIRPVAIAPLPLPPSGISYRTTWRAEVSDWKAFLGWVLHEGQFDLVSENAPALNALARKFKRENAAPPGVRFISEQGVATR